MIFEFSKIHVEGGPQPQCLPTSNHPNKQKCKGKLDQKPEYEEQSRAGTNVHRPR